MKKNPEKNIKKLVDELEKIKEKHLNIKPKKTNSDREKT